MSIVDSELKNKDIKELFKALTLIKDSEEAKKIIRDLCTIAEIKAMAERFQVAKLVKQGLSYREIAKKTGASTTTVTRVAHWIHHGMGGYDLILERFK